MADDPDPVAVFQFEPLCLGAVHIDRIGAVDLTQPCVLRSPAVIHRHRPLGDGVHRVLRHIDRRALERRIPERQGVEIGLDPLALGVGRLHRPVSLRGEAEALQRLGIELHDDLVGGADKTDRGGVVQIILVGVLEIALFRRQLVLPETAILDIVPELVGIGRTGAVARPVLAAPAGQHADPRRALVIGDVIGIAARIAGGAVFRDQAGQADPRAQLDQHVLERADIAVRRHDRLADRIGGPVGRADRPVEQADAVPAFEIGRIGQHEVGVGHHLRPVGVGIEDFRYLVLPGRRIAIGQHVHRARRVH